VLAVVVGGVGALSHHRTAAEVAERALAVQRAITGIARAEGAAVDERIDGGVMAVFGLAQPRADAAAVALRCARAVLERVTALEAVFEGPRLHVRLGVETGRVVTGNFGLPNCPELRTVGEAVDTASRLAAEAAPGEALAGPGASRRSRRATDEALTMRADGSGALRIA
jgi:adenylate cyclase